MLQIDQIAIHKIIQYIGANRRRVGGVLHAERLYRGGRQPHLYPRISAILTSCYGVHEELSNYVRGARVRCRGLSDFGVRDRKSIEKKNLILRISAVDIKGIYSKFIYINLQARRRKSRARSLETGAVADRARLPRTVGRRAGRVQGTRQTRRPATVRYTMNRICATRHPI